MEMATNRFSLSHALTSWRRRRKKHFYPMSVLVNCTMLRNRSDGTWSTECCLLNSKQLCELWAVTLGKRIQVAKLRSDKWANALLNCISAKSCRHNGGNLMRLVKCNWLKCGKTIRMDFGERKFVSDFNCDQFYSRKTNFESMIACADKYCNCSKENYISLPSDSHTSVFRSSRCAYVCGNERDR